MAPHPDPASEPAPRSREPRPRPAPPDGPPGPPGGACPHCGRPRPVLALPLAGPDARGVTGLCACELAAREADAQARAAERARALAAERLAYSGVARRYQAARLAPEAARPGQAAIIAALQAYVARFPDGGRGVALVGPPGAGKTSLAAALTHALIHRGAAALQLNVPHLLWLGRAAAREAGPTPYEDLVQRAVLVDHLVLDDLGRERPTEWVRETLYVLVDTRYAACRPTSLTTNLGFRRLADHVGAALTRRLAETTTVHLCPGPAGPAAPEAR